MSDKLIFIFHLQEKLTGLEMNHIFVIAHLKLREYFFQSWSLSVVSEIILSQVLTFQHLENYLVVVKDSNVMQY